MRIFAFTSKVFVVPSEYVRIRFGSVYVIVDNPLPFKALRAATIVLTPVTSSADISPIFVSICAILFAKAVLLDTFSSTHL